ncbi:MAG: hypothetical protein WB784_13535 [Rhodanobacteraceae bacterium]
MRVAVDFLAVTFLAAGLFVAADFFVAGLLARLDFAAALRVAGLTARLLVFAFFAAAPLAVLPAAALPARLAGFALVAALRCLLARDFLALGTFLPVVALAFAISVFYLVTWRPGVIA